MLTVLGLGILWFSGVSLAILDGRRKRIGVIAVIALMAAIVAVVALGVKVRNDGPQTMVAGDWPAGVGIGLNADMLGVTFALLSLGVLLAALIFEVVSGVRSQSFPALVLLLGAGLTGVFLTADAFNFYVFFEIAMISSYVLTGYGDEGRQLRSATIFAIVNLLGSAFFLMGIAALYHQTGRLDMAGIAQRVALLDPESVILSAVLIFTAFGIKLGIFPFHFWLPAVYTGTRPAVAAILSGAVANIGTYGLIRWGGGMLPDELRTAAPMFFALGVVSIIYGSLQAISRRSVAEVVAYSSIGQVGFILVALAIGGPAGFTAAVLFAIVNAVNKTLLFLSENLRGWLTGFAFAIGAFSVAGVPPAGGFLGKAGLFRVAAEDDNWVVIALVVVGSVLSFIYMFQIYQRRFMTPEVAESANVVSSPASVRAVVVVLAVITLLIGIWPEPVLWVSEQAGRSFALVSP
jgi:multicomponent Na+:H+ antiporter subunit D